MKIHCRTMLFFYAALLSSCVAKAQDYIPQWHDVSPDHWTYTAVTELQQRKILGGYPEGYFRGKRGMTREEFGVALQRFLANGLTQRAIVEKSQIDQQVRLSHIARQIKLLTQNGIDLFAPVPAESLLYPLLAEMRKKDLISDYRSVKAPLTRFDVLLCLRDFRYFWYAEVLRDKRKQEWVSPELLVRIHQLQDEFRADMEAFDALIKKNSWRNEDLPWSVELLREALQTQSNSSPSPK